jgi:hypothetical protein
MTGKTWFYSGLMVLVLGLMGFGIWFVLSPEDKIEIPEGDPMVLMDINNPETVTLSQLSIYEDGTVIFVEDSYPEMPIPQGEEFTRTWRAGKAGPGDIEYFFTYLDSVGFNEIEYAYLSPDEEKETVPVENTKAVGISLYPGGPADYIRIYADNSVVNNTIYALGFFTPGSEPYSELPYPVNFIYMELVDIIENNTEEVLVEELTK